MTNIEKLIERTGKEGEIVRVLVDVLEHYSKLGCHLAEHALAKAEELAGEL